MELEDPARVRVAPAVDELVVIADHEELPPRSGEDVDEGELRAIEILELVHEHVLEALLDEGAALRARHDVGDGEVDLVVERLAPADRLQPTILRVRGGERDAEDRLVAQRFHPHLDRFGVFESGTHPRERGEERAHRVGAARRPERVKPGARRLHGLAHERALASTVAEREARPHDLALVAVSEGVERGAVDGWRTAVAQAARRGDAKAAEALFELFGGLAVERQEQDLARVGAAGDELGDAADERLGLA